MVIDVGANKGQFAYFAAMRWPHARIYSFEPLAGPRNLLGDRVTVFDCAIGDTDGEAVLHVASREDSSSLLPLGSKQKSLFDMDEVGTVTVPVRRLDGVFDEIERPSLLKIDVQGFEYEVLLGAAGILSRIDRIYVEVSSVELYKGQHRADRIEAHLADHGFRLVGRYNGYRDPLGTLVQEDALYMQTDG